MPSRSRSRRIRAVGGLTAVCAAVLGLAALPGSASAASGGGEHRFHPASHLSKPVTSDDVPQAKGLLPKKGTYGFLLKLDTTSTAARFKSVRATSTRAEAVTAAKDQFAVVKRAQRDVESHLSSLKGTTSVLYRTHAVLAGVAVRTDVRNAKALAALPGVAAVYPITPKQPDNSYAVPFQGAPVAWEGDGSGQNLGAGVTIADIDTGLDYTHADFGGLGTTAAYEEAHAADTTAPAAGSYNPNKFDAADSYDLAGDDYNADPTSETYQPTPHPDPNPLDCSPEYGGDGHGSHTAGTLAGYGVNANGTTYAGPYDSEHVSTANASDFEIGPGMAPEAKLISYRVFGCEGSTDLVSDAIDRAMDPNDDGDTSDHADVINLSLGSDFGSPDDADAVEADAAAKLGATLSISMGNSYDEYDVGGSPGVAQRAITVAASVDAQSITDGASYTIDGASHNASVSRAGLYDWATKPDLLGTVVGLTGDDVEKAACSTLTSADAAAVQGKIAFVEWDDAAVNAGTSTGCGSTTRAENLEAAGASGFVFADTTETFSSGINGSDTIPGVLMAKSGADTIRTALGLDQTVVMTGTTTSSVTVTVPDDNDKVTDFSSRGIREEGHLKPDVAAVGASVFSVLPGSGTQGQDMSGTSMAAPMVGGLAALVIGKHHDWTSEQVKADIMNTADKNLYVNGSATPHGDRYAPMRVGSGRIDAASALSNSVLAYVADAPGAVSASFGPLAVTQAQTLTKTITVQNTGTSAVSYSTGFDSITTVPGVTYTVSPSTINIGAGQTANATLTLHVPDPAVLAQAMAFDPTKATTTTDSEGYSYPTDPTTGAPVDVIAEASGNVTFTPTSGSAPSLRVPAYAAPRPASTMSAPAQVVVGSGGTGRLALSGGDFGYDGDDPLFSLASGYELQATSGTAPACTADVTSQCLRVPEDSGADIADVGTTSDTGTDSSSRYLYVAIGTHGQHSTPAGKVEFDIYIDTDGDGQPDLVAYNTRLGNSDVFVEDLVDISTGDLVDQELLAGQLEGVDTAVYDSSVLVAPIWLGDAGLGQYLDGDTIKYGIRSYTSSGDDEIDEVGFDDNGAPDISVNVEDPAVSLSDSSPAPFVLDLSGDRPSVAVNEASYRADGGLGLMVVHHQNAPASQVQVVGTTFAPAVTLTTSATSVPLNATVTAGISVADQLGPVAGTVSLVDTASGRTLTSAPVALVAGKATVSFTPTTRAGLSLQAVYTPPGGTDLAPTTSATVPIGVAGWNSPVVLKVKKKVHLHHKVKVRVSIPTLNGVTPTGVVTLKVGSKSHTATLVGGRAVFKVKATTKGRLKLKARYAGDATYVPVSATKVVRVT